MRQGQKSARGRYAPSPTGRLHAGNARTALLAWLASRLGNGEFLLRSEDLDRARLSPGGEAALLDDLAWLGLDWDEGPDRGGPHAPYRQSERTALYDAAVARLLEDGRAFACACTRSEVARAVSAPHPEDEEGPRYPGTCRTLAPGEAEARARGMGRGVSIRFRASADQRWQFRDLVHETVELPAGGVDDFVLRRGDGVAAYQLAVVVDDAAMDVGLVVRGADLLMSTPRQLALYSALGIAAPRFAHVPLLLTPGGERIAKRTRPTAIADLRAAGIEAAAVVGRLAASAGLIPPGDKLSPTELLQSLPDEQTLWSRLRREPATWRDDE